jgi:transposase-like protein
MPCPECHNENERLIIKNGTMCRKKPAETQENSIVMIPPKKAKVQRYQCTVCGYTSRGARFGLPEMVKEKEEKV